ncbi:MAG TPA: CHAD domain-containing protein [Anaerolineales bacterium]|jgi:CHAD domain-containing protein
MTDPKFFLESFDQRREEYRTNLELCRAEFSEKAVHDLRVATRRLLAVIEISRNLLPGRAYQKLRRKLKEQLDGFDDLRDVQVMLLSVSANLEELPDLARFHSYLQKREQRLLLAAQKQVAGIKVDGLQRGMDKIHARLAEIPPAGLPTRVLNAVDKAYRTVKRRFGWMDPDEPASIHSVRVAFKKFRYMLECAQPALNGFPQAQFKRMHDYQTYMGNIQDAEILLNTLARFEKRHAKLKLDQAGHFYEAHYSHVLSTYLDNKAELVSFWRANPDAQQPWMTKLKQEV